MKDNNYSININSIKLVNDKNIHIFNEIDTILINDKEGYLMIKNIDDDFIGDNKNYNFIINKFKISVNEKVFEFNDVDMNNNLFLEI